MQRMRTTGRAVAAVGLCAGLTVSLTAMPASAAPGTGDGTSANLVYSVNGAAWSDSVTAQRGDTVTARLFYDTAKESTVDGVSLTSQIPDGFTYVPGSTRNVLAPGSNVATGAVGAETKAAAVADSVWSGDTLTVSPSAGFNGESNASQTGVLRNGVKRYLNLHQCAYYSSGNADVYTVLVPRAAGVFSSGTNTSNAAQNAADCTPGSSMYPLQSANAGAQALDLLGNRFVNLIQCAYYNSTGPDVYTTSVPTGQSQFFRSGTNASNTAQSALDCGPGSAMYQHQTGNSGVTALDLVGNRYVNLHQCAYYSPGNTDLYTTFTGQPQVFQSGTNASNTAETALDCAAGSTMYPLQTGNSGVLALDTLDTARGQGFIEFAFTSEVPEPAQCGETVTEPELVSNRTGVLSGAGTGNPSSSASVTLAEYLDEGEPCPVPVELVDDAASTVVDGPTEIDLVGNDTIPEGSSAVVVDAASAQGGTVVDNGDGTVTYTPAPGFVGTDSFTYRVTGPDGVEVSATVTVTVTEDDEPPVPMVAGGFAAAGLLGLAGLGTARTLRNRRQD